MSAVHRDLVRLAANGVWLLVSLPDAVAYYRAMRADLGHVQSDVLRRVLSRNADTKYGRRYDFANIRGVDDYQRRLPLTTYDDYSVCIEHIGTGAPGVLSKAPVRLFEPTSGSTAPTKYVPYTPELKAQFNRAIAPWIVDLYRRHPDLFRGQAYWSVSPVGDELQRTAGGIPVGFADDADYLGDVAGAVVRSVMAVPPAVRWIRDINAFRYTTLLFLLASPRLALISVWNPSFLILLSRPLREWWSAIAEDLMLGRISPPAPIEPALARQLQAMLHPDPRRAQVIRAIFTQVGDQPALCHRQLWPHLRVISCWADGPALHQVAELMRLFPHAELQPKGLVATEGIVSIPIGVSCEHALAVKSHFFEFIPHNSRGSDDRPLLAHQLERGASYEAVLTTDVFYRYRLHDIVQVTGQIGNVPTVRFIGKTNLIADAFGEKLNERHVRLVIESATASYPSTPGFAMLAFEEHSMGGRYLLFLEWPDQTDSVLAAVAAAVERRLTDNYHYRYCRDLGQLQSVAAFRVSRDALEAYVAQNMARGQRLGDIKPTALHPVAGWASRFDGYVIADEA